ncbi:MAG: methyltransferase [Bacteroidota bacterium]
MLNYGNDNSSALEAKFKAQKIAFAPIMFQAARALRNLGILELLMKERKGLTTELIAERLQIQVYGVKVLLEAGLSMEIVRVENNQWFLTKTGYFLQYDELTRVNMDFTHDVNYLGMFHLEESIRQGKPAGLKVFGEWDTVYEGLFELPEDALKSWLGFDHFYSDYAFPELMPIVFKNKPAHIMDVGGNTGKFALECVAFNSGVKVTIVDLPGQVVKAAEAIRRKGFADRINTVATNLLDHSVALPKGADIIWMSQFLDCFSQADVLSLLIRAKEAMQTDSRLFILETYWDKQEFEASTYSLHATSLYFTCIANGCSQMYHSGDLLKLIGEAGLEVDESFENVGVSHTLLTCKIK